MLIGWHSKETNTHASTYEGCHLGHGLSASHGEPDSLNSLLYRCCAGQACRDAAAWLLVALGSEDY